MTTRKRRAAFVAVALAAAVGASVGTRSLAMRSRIRANVWNAGDIVTMLRNYNREHGRYPATLVELGPYNVTTNNVDRRREVAQDLTQNSWGQAFIYASDGAHYTLVSPGRHGYQRARVVGWPEFDGPHHPDTSLLFRDGDAVELALARWQRAP